jgi:hypothetical protein
LQALFVERRTYPLAYNKWIREQVTEWLTLPGLYEELPPIRPDLACESARARGRQAGSENENMQA